MQKEAEKCDAAIALEKCRQQLVARRYDEAVAELQHNASYRSRKLKLVVYLLAHDAAVSASMYLRTRDNGQRGLAS